MSGTDGLECCEAEWLPTLENSLEVSHKATHRVTLWPRNTTIRNENVWLHIKV